MEFIIVLTQDGDSALDSVMAGLVGVFTHTIATTGDQEVITAATDMGIVEVIIMVHEQDTERDIEQDKEIHIEMFIETIQQV